MDDSFLFLSDASGGCHGDTPTLLSESISRLLKVSTKIRSDSVCCSSAVANVESTHKLRLLPFYPRPRPLPSPHDSSPLLTQSLERGPVGQVGAFDVDLWAPDPGRLLPASTTLSGPSAETETEAEAEPTWPSRISANIYQRAEQIFRS